MSAKSNSKSTDWLIFLVSGAVTVALLVYAPAWFWVPLPFVLTYLTKAFDAL
ncbi:MAG: hypothetical protein K1X68_11030 [Saprospiraceae bacterium]|nr:hypothetical protein [Saprospiraceae bacterium]HMW38734.1 hypothetical protein [Saprospiraceae bacterium]HMX88608.1 hypothetical protein [Saprospiraceae bacterium]HMZ40188.1 hypothetical protein [Saprospiraceae bacterium]HNA63610.1 hypothetical protein [Saprospiraceae bacterium]